MIYKNKDKVSGYYYSKMKMKNNINSSIYIPKSIYAYDIFPQFVAGGFVITNTILFKKIYYQLKIEKKIIYREDMHMGVIYYKNNISFQKINRYYHRKQKSLSLKEKLKDICWHGY